MGCRHCCGRRGWAGWAGWAGTAVGGGVGLKAHRRARSSRGAGAVPQPVAVIRACWADGRPARRPRGVHGARFSSRRGPCVAHGALGRHDGAPQATEAARGSVLLVSFSGEINTDGERKTPMRSPQRPPRMPSTPTAQHDDQRADPYEDRPNSLRIDTRTPPTPPWAPGPCARAW